MDDEYLTDQQQAERVRSWVATNGVFIVAGVVLGLGALFGWNQWQRHQRDVAEEASAVYEKLRSAVNSNRFDEALANHATLLDEYGSSAYVDQARLLIARVHIERSETGKAIEALEAVADGGGTGEIRTIARLRLGRLLNQEGKPEEALKNLDVPASASFAPLFHDVRGDVLHALGRLDEARSEYEQALNGAESVRVIDRLYTQAKLDDLGGATQVPAADVLPAPGASGAASASADAPAPAGDGPAPPAPATSQAPAGSGAE